MKPPFVFFVQMSKVRDLSRLWTFLLIGITLVSAQGRDYKLTSAGEEKTFRLIDQQSVVEVRQGVSLSPLAISPRLTLLSARADSIPDLANAVGAVKWSPSGIGRHYLFDFETPGQALAAAETLQALGYEATLAIRRQKHSRFTPKDPLFADQWHLKNTGQRGGTRGIDLNIFPAWAKSRGKGVSVAVLDDGLEWKHPDLRANCFPLSSGMHFDFNGNDTDPAPGRGNEHGTAVAGVLASPSNTLGGLGVAPEAKLAGLRLTADATDGETEARAFAWKNASLSAYNNSWGPTDDGMTVEGPEPIARDAITAATKFGRSGRGSIFVWACGNGRADGDESNYDGYSNMPETIAVGAVGDQGRLSGESESGANVVVVAPSSSAGRQGIVCADLVGARGYNANGENDGNVIPFANYSDLNYTNDFGMTSGAAPQVSGVVALMLGANPNLGWRDVQEILITTARRVSPTDADWKKNGAGFFFNHKFGAGLVDASAAVDKAAQWKNLSAATSASVTKKGLNLAIPDNKTSGAAVAFDVSDTAKYPRLRVEHVQVRVSVKHAYRGDLRFVLTSPSGMTSVIESRENDNGTSLTNWPFLSVRHWGENSTGKWKLSVMDTFAGDTGMLVSATLTIFGTRQSSFSRAGN
jgi:subtilisin-like proprotein convertase family protein